MMDPTWPPTSESALQLAVGSGAFEERHWVDVKRELGKGDSANKELAADLASFSVDGGRLVIGVDEGNNFALTPVTLHGLAERIESVARSRVDEPLDVEFTTIRTADPDRGYLVVTIPMSPRAPHMVGHRYWYRGDKTKYPLPDAEVARLMDRRKRWETEIKAHLDNWIAKDPFVPETREGAHFYVVCSPVPWIEDMMLQPLQGPNWQETLRQLVGRVHRPGGQMSPDLAESLSILRRRPQGWVCSTREEPKYEAGWIELEITEDGLLQMMHGRASAQLQRRNALFEAACLGPLFQMVSLAGVVSEEVNFLGNWDFGVAITGVRGTTSSIRAMSFNYLGDSTLYGEDDYRKTTRATRQEIRARPGALVDKLLGRFLRALGVDQLPQLQEFLTPKSETAVVPMLTDSGA